MPKENIVQSSQLDWDCVEATEQKMGVENKYVTEYELMHDNCQKNIDFEISAWEYSVGSFNTDEYQIERANKLNKFKIDFVLH